MASLRTWISAARPRTLPAAVVPVAVGTAVAHAAGAVAWGPAAGALAGALALQIASNFANDAFDAERGADGPDRIGPVRAVAAGLITPRAMKRATAIALAAATAVGAYLVAVGGAPILALGIASMIAAVAYTAGPFPLAYHGLGDVFVLACFGFGAVCGTAYVQLGEVPALAWWAAIPVGSLATAILVVNNLRDRATDARVGKRTLAVRLGRRGALVEYGALLGAALAVPVALALGAGAPPQQGPGCRTWLLLPIATAPLAVGRLRALVRATDGPAFHRCLAETAQLLLIYGALFTAGLVLA
jgi:1,4-dihydroxy-2-naphthoate octaprenyltransferase